MSENPSQTLYTVLGYLGTLTGSYSDHSIPTIENHSNVEGCGSSSQYTVIQSKDNFKDVPTIIIQIILNSCV